MEEQEKKEKASKPFYQKWWFWLIIAVVVLAVIGGVTGAKGSGASGDNTDKTQTPNEGSTPATAASTYYIGDTVTSGSAEFTVTGVRDTTVLGSALLGESTENNFIVVTVRIKNNGNSELTLTGSMVYLYRDKAKYEYHTGSIYLDDGFYVVKEIGAGITVTVSFAFETPTASTTGEYELGVKGKTLTVEKKIALRNKAVANATAIAQAQHGASSQLAPLNGILPTAMPNNAQQVAPLP